MDKTGWGGGTEDGDEGSPESPGDWPSKPMSSTARAGSELPSTPAADLRIV